MEALTSVLLLAPQPPMLFMGEEFATNQPFLFFCDFGPELANAVTEGRRREFSRFARFADPAVRESIPDPNAPETFKNCVLDWSAIERMPQRTTLEPVSYTHLDVYKRQHHEAIPFKLPVICKDCQWSSILDTSFAGGLKVDGTFKGGAIYSLAGRSLALLKQEAVSYTHLDVYKRQAICRRPARACSTAIACTAPTLRRMVTASTQTSC